MQRKKTPEEIRRSELIRELIKLDGLKTAEDAQNFVKEILGSTVQNMLVGSLMISLDIASTITGTR